MRRQLGDILLGRDSWTIRLPRTRVLAAARKKVAFHRSRVKHWLSVRAKAEKAVKANGLKIKPNLMLNAMSVTASSYSNTPKREIAELDQELVNNWLNANRKVEEHRERARSYSKYAQFLENKSITDLRGGDSTVELTFEDAEFFGIVQEAAE